MLQQIQRFPCEGCGADLVWDPKASSLKCPYCGKVQAMPDLGISASATVEERDFAAYLRVDPSRLERITPQALQVTCTGCGATISFEPPEVAGDCPFCGAKIVAQPIAADPLVAPEGVLPFAVPQKDAVASVQKWISTRWFAPNALKKQARHDGIGGVYLPFWTFDAQTYSSYRGERGEHYWEDESYTDSEGKRQTRRVQRTRWYSASGNVSRFFDDVLIAATKSLPRNRLDALEPWGLEEIKPYSPAYLSGYKAQRYQVDLGEGFEMAKGVMAQVIDGDVRRDIGGDEQRVHSINTRYDAITFKHLLLPIWISAYRYQGKVFQTMVNARTAEVQGERPYSVWKIAACVILGLIALAVFFYFYNQGRN